MHDEPSKESGDDRALEEMAAALREAGGADAQSLPPDVRRGTLQALWVADAARYERKATRRARVLRLAAVAVAAAAGVGLFGLFARLALQEWAQRQAHVTRQQNVRRTLPPAATLATTAPAARTPAPAPAPTTRHGTAEAPPADERPAPAAAPAGVVGGRVVFLGEPPSERPIRTGMPECHAGHPPLVDESVVVGDGGGLANVVVSIALPDGVPPPDAAPPASPPAPAVLDQRGCRYVPRVLAVMVGQPIVVRNSDPFLHNVHSLSVDNPAFNFGQPNVDPGRRVGVMKVPERFNVKCDVHPWMIARVSVFEHPYFAVTGTDGAFSIPGALPDGQYTLTAWHEKLGEKQAHVIIENGRASAADFVFDGAEAGG